MPMRLFSWTPIFHGWYVVVACVVASMVIVGARNGIGAFVIPMSEDFGWSRGTVSIAAFLGIFVNGLTQPFLGNAIDRFGSRKVIVLSLVLLGLGTLGPSMTTHIFFLSIIFGLVSGTAYSGASLPIIRALLAKWFRRRRATVLGINGAGAALGGLTLIPLAIFIIEVGNWWLAWAALGLIVLFVAVLLGYLTIDDGSEKLGLRPDSDSEQAKPELSHKASQPSSEAPNGPLLAERWLDSFRSWPMWQLTTAYIVDGISISVLLVHFVPYANERGESPATAALMFRLMMAASIVGSTSTGTLLDPGWAGELAGRGIRRAGLRLRRYAVRAWKPWAMNFCCGYRAFLECRRIPHHHLDC